MGEGGKTAEWTLPRLTGLFQWGPDGSKFYFRSVYRGQPLDETALPAGWYTMHPQTGAVEKATTGVPAAVGAQKGLISFATSFEVPGRGAIASVRVPGVVIHEGELHPTEPSFAIAYISQGVTLVRALIHVPKEALLKAKADALKAELMSKGKQVGIAFQIFAADADDAFPENKGWEDRLMPYVRNRQLLAGFNYTYGGGPLGGKDPGKTSLGFFSGAGGRAVVYADGSVRWESDNP